MGDSSGTPSVSSPPPPLSPCAEERKSLLCERRRCDPAGFSLSIPEAPSLSEQEGNLGVVCAPNDLLPPSPKEDSREDGYQTPPSSAADDTNEEESCSSSWEQARSSSTPQKTNGPSTSPRTNGSMLGEERQQLLQLQDKEPALSLHQTCSPITPFPSPFSPRVCKSEEKTSTSIPWAVVPRNITMSAPTIIRSQSVINPAPAPRTTSRQLSEATPTPTPQSILLHQSRDDLSLPQHEESSLPSHIVNHTRQRSCDGMLIRSADSVSSASLSPPPPPLSDTSSISPPLPLPTSVSPIDEEEFKMVGQQHCQRLAAHFDSSSTSTTATATKTPSPIPLMLAKEEEFLAYHRQVGLLASMPLQHVSSPIHTHRRGISLDNSDLPIVRDEDDAQLEEYEAGSDDESLPPDYDDPRHMWGSSETFYDAEGLKEFNIRYSSSTAGKITMAENRSHSYPGDEMEKVLTVVSSSAITMTSVATSPTHPSFSPPFPPDILPLTTACTTITPPVSTFVRPASGKSGSSVERKSSRKSAWYNPFPSTMYKQKCDHYRRLFSVEPADRLLADYSCALQKDILIQGRMYIAEHHICFHANIFGWETKVVIKNNDIRNVTKERAAKFFPTAIQIITCRPNEKYFFTSFTARDKAYLMVFRVWQNALLKQPMPAQELWHWVHASYGEDLGLTSEDDDYVSPNQYTRATLLTSSGGQVSSSEDVIAPSYDTPTTTVVVSETSCGTSISLVPVTTVGSLELLPSSSLMPSQSHESSSSKNGGKRLPRPLSVIPTISDSSYPDASIQRSVSLEVPVGRNGSREEETEANKSEGGILENGMIGTPGKSSPPGGKALAALVKKRKKFAKTKTPSVVSQSSGGTPRLNRRRAAASAPAEDPTDVSDSTESEAGGPQATPRCPGAHNEGRVLVDNQFPFHVDTLFTLLFTSSKYILGFLNEKKTYNITLGQWNEGTNPGEKIRSTNYIVPLTGIGPKTADVTQNMTMLACSKPGAFYAVDVEVQNQGVPYADTFYVFLHICMTRLSNRETQLTITAQIKYRKNAWGLVKAFIEKHSWAGLEDYYFALEKDLLRYAAEEGAELAGGRRKKRSARAAGAIENGPLSGADIPPASSGSGVVSRPGVAAGGAGLRTLPPGIRRPLTHPSEPPALTESGILPSATFLRIILALLLLLLLCNAILFTRLWSLEDQTTSIHSSKWIQVLQDREMEGNEDEGSKPVQTAEDWIALLQQQERNHRQELERWKSAVSLAANMLRQIEESLRSMEIQMAAGVENASLSSSDNHEL